MPNSTLEDSIHEIPDDILEHLIRIQNKNIEGFNGVKRLNNLINERTVTFGQLKKIIHEFKSMNPDGLSHQENIEYELMGGDVFKDWAFRKYDELLKGANSKKNSDSNSGKTDIINNDQTNLGPGSIGKVDTSTNVAELPKMMGGLLERMQHLIKVI